MVSNDTPYAVVSKRSMDDLWKLAGNIVTLSRRQ